MGFCVKCRNFFVPDMMLPLEKDELECVFCNKGKEEFFITGEGLYTKKRAINEYKEFLKMLSKKRHIASTIIKGEFEKRLKDK